MSTSEEIGALEITADGPWSVNLRDALGLPRIDSGGEATGVGDSVILYFGDTTIANIQHSGESNFAVWSYANGSDLLVNEIGDYSGQVRWQSGPALIEISADGPWSIELE
jgi:hypothetical protein